MVSMAGVGILCVLRESVGGRRLVISNVGVYSRATKGYPTHSDRRRQFGTRLAMPLGHFTSSQNSEKGGTS